jgi:hypothetical protein
MAVCANQSIADTCTLSEDVPDNSRRLRRESPDQTTGVDMPLIRPAGRSTFALLGTTGAAVAVLLSAATAGCALPACASTSGHVASSRSARVRYSVGPISDVSAGCPGTGDISEAVDQKRHLVYQEFEGCDHDNGIGFARSTNGGVSYTRPVALPGSNNGWDPWLAVAPDSTLYAGFMNTINHTTYPIIDVSHDFGRTFVVERSLKPTHDRDWGDADYLAVGSNGTLYVAWGYGPTNSDVKNKCSPTGSCWSTNGDLNVVVQSSTDDAKTFTPMSVVNPGYPDGGAIEGDVTVAPDGAIDVLYQDYAVVNKRTLRLAHGHEFFTTSHNGGKGWSKPLEVGASAGQITINEWWNDGSIATDSSGDLYATWDTQGRLGKQNTDIAWVSFSKNGGEKWSAPIQAIPGHQDVPHITQVTGAGSGRAYVACLSSNDPRGYALYLRTLSISADGTTGRWLSNATRISRQFGNPNVFPGDTFGITTFSPTSLVMSWGSAVPGSAGKKATEFAAPVKALTS